MSHENINEVKEFYENGAEINRLERGLGIIEAARTKEILARYIEPGMAAMWVAAWATIPTGWQS